MSVAGFYVSKDEIIYDFIILFLLLNNLEKTRFSNLETITNVQAIQIKAWRHIPQPARVYASIRVSKYILELRQYKMLETFEKVPASKVRKKTVKEILT